MKQYRPGQVRKPEGREEYTQRTSQAECSDRSATILAAFLSGRDARAPRKRRKRVKTADRDEGKFPSLPPLTTRRWWSASPAACPASSRQRFQSDRSVSNR